MGLSSRDIFQKRTEVERSNSSPLLFVLIAIVVNGAVLLFNFRWLESSTIAIVILSILYIILFSIGVQYKKDWFCRLKDKRDYFRGKRIIVSNYDIMKNAPLFNGDYIYISSCHANSYERKTEYLKFVMRSKFVGRDFPDFNDVFNREMLAIDLVEDEPKYVVKDEHSYERNSLYDKMERLINKDGFVIKAIFNKYGDLKWEQSDDPTEPTNENKVMYYIKVCGWYVAIYVPLVIAAFKIMNK